MRRALVPFSWITAGLQGKKHDKMNFTGSADSTSNDIEQSMSLE